MLGLYQNFDVSLTNFGVACVASTESDKSKLNAKHVHLD